jgi:hypothetical protein
MSRLLPLSVAGVEQSGRMTTHYSAAEIGNLLAAVNRIGKSREFSGSAVNFPRRLGRCVTSVAAMDDDHGRIGGINMSSRATMGVI